MPSTEQPPTAPPPDSSADLQRPSVGSRILQRLPIVLMVSLVAMHVLVAAGDFIKRDYFPAHLIHAAYTVVIDQTHYLNGYLPQVVHRDEIGPISKVIIDGRRGPEPQWSDPRIWYRELIQGRLRKLWASHGYMSRLPLPFFLPGVAHKVFGGSILAAALTPQLFLALLLFSVYGIGRRAGGPWLGLAAAVIASGYPGVYQIARTHHDSLATSALAAAMICLLVYCRGFTRLRICALAGVTAYLSTLVSESVSFTLLIALIAAGPFAMEFVRLLRRCRSRSADAMRGMVGLALFLVPVCLLFGWDRIGAFMAHGQSSLSEVSAFALVGSHVPSSLHGFVSLSAYFFRITFATLQPLMTLWLIAGAVLLWRAPRGERLAVALSVAVPLVLLSVMPKKADQYIVPLCPGLALTTALGLRGIRSLKLRRWAMGLAALCGLMMPLFYALVPSRVRDRVDLDQISPLIKTVVETSFLPLGDKGNRPHLSHRTRGLPLAIAGNELVAHDLKNNPRGSGPRRVAVFGPIGHYVEGFRYVVELTHPEMFVIDFLQGSLPLEFQYQIIAQLPAYKFDYLVFIGEEFEDDPDEFPYEGWDAVEAREDYISWVTQPGRHGLGESAQKEWEARVRRFAADLLKRQWKRVELSAGPIYQAVGPGR